ncbi:MAG: phasin [Phreatobacter sp.]|uniref:phasin n=1 Tax=Phreatobacter sp. TaxID=1966341 RepID=UPI002736050E|nr:phasin [Phreatobacter sp.]MDP2802860.1 phasin [Phreatobacter sp.]
MAGRTPGAYEIPQEMREFADKSVEQARKAFDGFVGAAQRTVSAMDGSTGAVQSSAQDVGRKAIAFAETNVAASFDYAQRLVQARDMAEVMEIQTRFLQDQMKAMEEQARELGGALAPKPGTRQD